MIAARECRLWCIYTVAWCSPLHSLEKIPFDVSLPLALSWVCVLKTVRGRRERSSLGLARSRAGRPRTARERASSAITGGALVRVAQRLPVGTVDHDVDLRAHHASANFG